MLTDRQDWPMSNIALLPRTYRGAGAR